MFQSIVSEYEAKAADNAEVSKVRNELAKTKTELDTTHESLKRCEGMLSCGTTSIKVLIDKARKLEEELR